MRTRQVSKTVELELGERCWYVVAELIATCYPYEPMVRYYPDGSGYPGSPAYAELDTVRALFFYLSDGTRVSRTAKNDAWFKVADEVVAQYVNDNFEDFEDDLLVLADDRDGY